MKMDDRWYMEWYWTQATPDEKRLIDKVGEFEHMMCWTSTTTRTSSPNRPSKVSWV